MCCLPAAASAQDLLPTDPVVNAVDQTAAAVTQAIEPAPATAPEPPPPPEPVVTEAVQPAVDEVTKAVETVAAPVEDAVAETTEAVTAPVKQTVDTVAKTTEAVTAPVKQTVDTVAKTTEAVTAPVKQTVDTVTTTVESVTAPVSRITTSVGDVVRTTTTPVTDSVAATTDSIVAPARTTKTTEQAPVASRPTPPGPPAPPAPQAVPATPSPAEPSPLAPALPGPPANVETIPSAVPPDAHAPVVAPTALGEQLAGSPSGLTARPLPAAATTKRRDAVVAPEPTTPAGGASISFGASGVPGPAPPGAVAFLLAALSLAAALTFTRLLAAPARPRPVLFVSAIERPG
jgi:hypothetical protein